MSRTAARWIDPTAIRWVVNYRQADKIREAFKLGENMTNEQIVNKLDSHSAGSLLWTKDQSKFIDQNGWDKWIDTDRSMGYSNHLRKMMGP